MSGSVFFGRIGTLRNYDGDGNEKVKNAIGFISKTTTLRVHYALQYISLPSLQNYDVKINDQILSFLEKAIHFTVSF